MPHLFFEKLELRQSTQTFSGIPGFNSIQGFPLGQYSPSSAFLPNPFLYRANSNGIGGYASSPLSMWFNPLPSRSNPFNPFWSGPAEGLYPIRQTISGYSAPFRSANALTTVPFSNAFVGALTVNPTTYIPPLSTTIALYAIPPFWDPDIIWP